MTVMMSYNTSNIDDDMFNKQYLHIIKIILKSRLMNIIDCYNNDIINKYMQVINSAIKECRDLLLLMHYKITRNFLLKMSYIAFKVSYNNYNSDS